LFRTSRRLRPRATEKHPVIPEAPVVDGDGVGVADEGDFVGDIAKGVGDLRDDGEGGGAHLVLSRGE